MSSLDMRTIVFSNLTNAVVCLLVMFLLWRQSRKRFEGIGFWMFDYFLVAAGLVLIVLRGTIHDWLSVVAANALIVGGALLGYIGLERFVGKRTSQVGNTLVLGAFVMIHAYFAFVQPNLAARTLNLSLGLLILCGQCARLLLHGVEPGMRPLTRLVGVVFALYSLLSVARIVESLIGSHPGTDFFQSGAFDRSVLLSYQVLFLLLTYSLVLMVNKRLLGDIRTQEEKFAKAFHHSPNAITLTRLSDGEIMEVNEGFSKITGYEYAEAIGKTTVGLHLWNSERDRLSAVEELATTGRIRDRELQIRKKSGEIVTGLFSAEVFRIHHGEFILSSLTDISDRKRAEAEREEHIRQLRQAMARVKQLSGLLPICASCKKIRDDQGYWTQIEAYIRDRSEAEFSHGICPECAGKLYPEISKKVLSRVTTDDRGKVRAEGRGELLLPDKS